MSSYRAEKQSAFNTYSLIYGTLYLWWHPLWHPRGLWTNPFHTQNVPGIITMILKENYEEIPSTIHEGNPFYPWTLKDPPGEAQMKIFQY